MLLALSLWPILSFTANLLQGCVIAVSQFIQMFRSERGEKLKLQSPRLPVPIKHAFVSSLFDSDKTSHFLQRNNKPRCLLLNEKYVDLISRAAPVIKTKSNTLFVYKKFHNNISARNSLKVWRCGNIISLVNTIRGGCSVKIAEKHVRINFNLISVSLCYKQNTQPTQCLTDFSNFWLLNIKFVNRKVGWPGTN